MRRIEIYTVSPAGRVTSSSLYTFMELRDIFGQRDAERLEAGKRVKSTQRGIAYRQKANAYNATH